MGVFGVVKNSLGRASSKSDEVEDMTQVYSTSGGGATKDVVNAGEAARNSVRSGLGSLIRSPLRIVRWLGRNATLGVASGPVLSTVSGIAVAWFLYELVSA